MFQWTSITEWLHPAVPPVKTLPFFRKYFHSTIIASICSYTVATLAMSLWLSEFTAERVANVYARVWTFLCVCREGLDACTRRLACSAFINREETEIGECVELERRRNVMKQDASAATAPHTRPHAASYSCLMAGLTELTLADELSVQTLFDSFNPNSQQACKQQNRTKGVLRSLRLGNGCSVPSKWFAWKNLVPLQVWNPHGKLKGRNWGFGRPIRTHLCCNWSACQHGSQPGKSEAGQSTRRDNLP